ncbi:von Willebrand factor A domain-containing protein 5B1 [Thunnus albacares]|uniref:von Willebrand factor A domain-containing protein 5B1 n=1 Tax=Thunnus albacares TaxID=8236 RepID=UPI001CF6D616|nr:von Willebrand factor A domain-containing protein 5B1 [Thunnus albacares]XP_044223195.1 von Willebrand factor A domain-containing protein 5B1 [Thunnus albacares]XP_044223196.1 von Willebrand factor A domain-containing protein 5B1 [Thunnus albacares]XP_044223197.1 von Willebrand factor A domain-containing protein 5B1 [Thunnus albacares]XP_044223198.1 von Willebrand factor A domain-containing protein 5B1 [Thunnus albacares]XP_044223199.1 von Willebrand factor A domain-containing protein 5B1 [
MVGLRNRSTWEPLLLKASCIKSCANGCSLGITAHLTYANADIESVEGVFVYPLGEKEVVVGFEAVIAGRLVGVQIQSRGKLQDCCLDCCPGSGLEGYCGNGREWGCCGSSNMDMQCTNGHLILDEDLERTTFIVGTGVIGPMDIVSVIISTTLELPTLENGAIRIVYPTLLTPIVTGQMPVSRSENGGKSEEIGPTSCFGATSGKQDRVLDSEQQCAHAIFTNPAANLAPYELNFQLLVRGACLLAGLESPTHALRADADPSAQSASATYITLAQEHPYDRHIEIILHLSEPHSPLVIIERGRLSFSQYEQLICSRRDFIRCTRKDSEPERKLEFVRKRYHKDILSSPVLMLNFCPDLLCEPLELNKATRELLFLVDRSGSMSGTNIRRVKDAMVVALKSLPSGTMLNIVGFGTTIKPLFTSSKLCTDVTLMQAYEYVQRMRADMRGTNLLGALSWVYQQPMQRSYPRQVFIVTDGSITNVAKVLELVRRNTCAGRCFGLGLGPRACRRLLQGVAKLTGGTTEFLDDEERLQPKLIKSLKKAFEPVLTDVRIDWYLPENMEALLSPNEIPPLYPGNRLIGYCTLYDMTNFKAKKTEGRGYKGVHRGSTGSDFCQSNDELSPPPASELMPVVTCADGADLEEALREISREISSEFSCARDTDPGTSPGVELDWSSDVRRRIQESSYIQEQYVLTRCSLSSERSLQTQSHSHIHASSNSDSADRAFLPDPHSSGSVLDTGSLPQGLEKMPLPEQRSSLSRWADSAWQQNLSAEAPGNGVKKNGRLDGGEESRRRQKALARSTMAARSFSSPQGELEMHRLRRALERVSFDQALGGRLDESDGETKPPSRGTLSCRSLTDSNGLLFPASPLDWDSFTDPEYLFTAIPPENAPPAQCRSLIHGLLSGRPVSWEVTVDLEHLWIPEGQETTVAEGCGGGGEVGGGGGESWEEIIHQLTARSVIRDFEKMAEKETDIGHGSAKRYRMKAIQTSKHCNIICMYTAFTTTDSNTNKGLPEGMDAQNTGIHLGNRRSSQSGSRRQRTYSVGLGRRRTSRDSEEIEDTWNSADRDDSPASPCSLTSWDSSMGGSTYSATAPAITGPACTRSQRSIESKSMESFFGTRFPLGRLRSSISSGKQVPLKSHCLSAETEKQPETEALDYLPLVRLQLASGAFLLTEIYSDCVQISLDRLKRASPYSLHRRSLSPPFRCTSPSAPTLSSSAKPPTIHHVTFSPSSCSLAKPTAPPFHHTPDDTPLMLEPRLRRRHLSDRDPVTSPPDLPSSEEGSLELSVGHSQSQSHGQADSGRGSETDVCESSLAEPADLQGSSQLAQEDLEGSSWATAVALAWLEHRCAGYFMEWELVAAKADFWLRCQELPEGVDLAGLKGAARQLFLLLRHWDENIKLNMLCYNPNNM